MRRRRYLAACLGAATISKGIGTTGATEGSEDEELTCPPDTTEAETETGGPDIELSEHELAVEENFLTETFVAATVENAGDGPSGRLELAVDWYDADANYLGDDQTVLQTLGPGETWAARVRHLGGDDEAIADYELDVAVEEEPPTAPDGLVLEDSEMHITEDEVVIDGLVANDTGAEASYIEAIAVIYDEDCVVLDDEWTNETDVPAGETWAFDLAWRDRHRIEAAATHRIILSDGRF